MAPATTSSPRPRAAASSSSSSGTQKKFQLSFNVIVFCFCLVGVGTLLGYTIFYVLFRETCADLLLEREQRHSASHTKLQTKYTTALDDIRQCEEDAEAKGELQELQGRLKAQATLSDKHQDLLLRHEKTLERISALQTSSEGSQSQIQTLKEEIKITQSSLEESSQQSQEAQRERDIIQRDLQAQREHTTNALQERSQENSKLRTELGSCEINSQGAIGKLAELKNLVQQQNLAAVIAMFGKGPYTIRFNLEFPSEPVEPNFFEMKIVSARHLPHTVLTLLNMVDNGLYVDTTIDVIGGRVVKGGNPSTVEPQHVKSVVLRRFANFGYSAHNTLFFDNESSPDTPCRQFSFGLNERGPGFVIYLTDEIEKNANNCPGVITEGRETMERLLNSHTNENGELTWKVPIVATYLVSVENEL